MMNCQCGERLSCIDTRPRKAGHTTRRYKCPACKTRPSTIELPAERIYTLEAVYAKVLALNAVLSIGPGQFRPNRRRKNDVLG